MSYKIWAEKEDGSCFQLFGNGEYPECFIDELKRQGCEFDEEGCFGKFEIKEIQPIINSIDKYIIDISNKARENGYSIYDFSSDFDCIEEEYLPLWIRIEMKIDCGYMFIVHNLISFFSDEIDKTNPFNYKIKEGCKIFFTGG